MKCVIAGGTGQIGQHLVAHWRGQGHEVVVLSRGERDGTVAWDSATLGPWAQHVDGADVVVNLAGRSVNCRYDARNRTAIYFSRLDSTRVLGEAIAAAEKPPRVWLNASTATIYQHATEAEGPQNEATGVIWRGDEPGVPDKWHFSVDVARRWEAEAMRANTPQTRRVLLRASMVMDPSPDGVFDVLRGLAKWRLGGFQGNGRQRVSWIHIDDFCRAMDFILDDDALEGPVNVCSPNPVTNRDFMRGLRQACGVSWGLPAMAWMLEVGAVFMRTETELLLKSRWVVPTRLQQAGFTFEHPTWPEAAVHLAAQ